jgi:lipid-A-disaccharide synthase
LPGSRLQELDNNTGPLLRSATLIHARRPDTRFLIACLNEPHRQRMQAQCANLHVPIEVHAGHTAEIIHLCHSCIAVSGSVSLELLHAAKPALTLYRVHWHGMILAHLLKRSRYISLVNLLAGKELYPEFLRAGCPAEEMAPHILHWLDDGQAYQALCSELAALRDRVAIPGACDRAASEVLDFINRHTTARAA